MARHKRIGPKLKNPKLVALITEIDKMVPFSNPDSMVFYDRATKAELRELQRNLIKRAEDAAKYARLIDAYL